jgi:hypothetical protein
VQLKDALAAMRAISLDPWLKAKVPLADGKQATAIDIQREYLREATPFVESGDLPDWTGEVLQHWRWALDELESDPRQLGSRLDAYLKLAIFDRQLHRANLDWAALRQALQVLEKLRSIAPESVVRAFLHESPSHLSEEHKALYEQIARMRLWRPVGLETLRFAVRLQALELNYHELGGIFDELAATGLVDPVVVSPEDVERAIHNPPPGGRAEARSTSIAQFHGQAWQSDWQYVINQSEEKWVDLRDPFANKHEVTPLPSSMSPRRHPSRLAELLGL